MPTLPWRLEFNFIHRTEARHCTPTNNVNGFLPVDYLAKKFSRSKLVFKHEPKYLTVTIYCSYKSADPKPKCKTVHDTKTYEFATKNISFFELLEVPPIRPFTIQPNYQIHKMETQNSGTPNRSKIRIVIYDRLCITTISLKNQFTLPAEC